MPDPLDPPRAPRAVDLADNGEHAPRAEGPSLPLPDDDEIDARVLRSDLDDAAAESDSDSDDERETSTAPKKRRRLRNTLEWVAVIAGALIFALGVRHSVAQAFYIPSESMEPTLNVGDRILVNKVSYRLHDVNRGDVVVFERPEGWPSGPEEIPDLVKRVIGLPGDTVEARSDGSVYINDRKLSEPYLPDDVRTREFTPREVPEGQVFVMGDNRGNSGDSRDHGAIDEDLIVGRVFLRIYPLGDIGGL